MLHSKRFFIFCMTIFILCTSFPVFAQTSDQLSIVVNNQQKMVSVPTENVGGVLMIPAKDFAEALGGTFYFNKSTLSGTITYHEAQLVYYLDEAIAQFNGKYLSTPISMKVIENRFMIPGAFCSSSLGMLCYIHTKKNQWMLFQPRSGKVEYQVQQGDFLWLLSQIFGTSIEEIKRMNGLTGDGIYVGQKLVMKENITTDNTVGALTTQSATLWTKPDFNAPVIGYLKAWTPVTVCGKLGDWYHVMTPKGSGYIYYTVTGITQDICFGGMGSGHYFESHIPVDTSLNNVTYKDYTVQKGDSLWLISEKFGVTNDEIAQCNQRTTGTTLYPGDVIKIPVYNIAPKLVSGTGCGEILDWFKEGQYILPISKEAKLIDCETGKSFMIKRTIGANHADVETLSLQDTMIMKEIFGGLWSWNRRPFILEVGDRRFAVSIAGMPHGGVDGAAFLQNISGRSDNWGYGPNYDAIAGNGMEGHFDLYFLNSIRHKDGNYDAVHQYNILSAGGLR